MNIHTVIAGNKDLFENWFSCPQWDPCHWVTAITSIWTTIAWILIPYIAKRILHLPVFRSHVWLGIPGYPLVIEHSYGKLWQIMANHHATMQLVNLPG